MSSLFSTPKRGDYPIPTYPSPHPPGTISISLSLSLSTLSTHQSYFSVCLSTPTTIILKTYITTYINLISRSPSLSLSLSTLCQFINLPLQPLSFKHTIHYNIHQSIPLSVYLYLSIYLSLQPFILQTRKTHQTNPTLHPIKTFTSIPSFSPKPFF